MQHPFLDYLAERDLVTEGLARQLEERIRLAREPIGMIALGHGLLTTAQIDTILDRQKHCSIRFGEIAVQLGFLTGEQVETLVRIQGLRSAVAFAETLALGGVLRYEDAVRYLGTFFARDDEMVELMSGK